MAHSSPSTDYTISKHFHSFEEGGIIHIVAMEENDFKRLIRDHLLPFFPGAKIGNTLQSTGRHRLAAFKDPCVLVLKPNEESLFRIELKRSQKFSKEEKKLIETFAEEINSIESLALKTNKYFLDLMTALPRQVIAKFLMSKKESQTTLHRAIRQFEALASQTYEGHQIIVALGITGGRNYGPINLEDLWKEDFAPVLSNGIDTMYLSGSDSRVFNLHSGADPVSDEKDTYAPYRLNSVASWCGKHQVNRVALVLNRNGEVLIFKSGRLQFARRRGTWCYYPHDSVQARMGQGFKQQVKLSIYKSCLDVSFGRTGGCVAIVAQRNMRDVADLVYEGDLLSSANTTKTKFLAKVIQQRFQNLDRRVRQELLAMDGATIMRSDGHLLAVGAIVKVKGGTKGGGRTAAANALSGLGVGIKISSDGPIVGFKNKKEVFRL